ncbi:MAG: hypothetical protein ACJ740_14370, partial [Gaiellales bacterium]
RNSRSKRMLWMVLAAMILGAGSVIISLVSVVGAMISRRAASAGWGAAAIVIACAVLLIVFQGYQCYNMTALVSAVRVT